VYVHTRGEQFRYPSSRVDAGGPERLARRYLECVLVQAASLNLRGAEQEMVFVTNRTDRHSLGRTGGRLLREIERHGVEVVIADYEHRPRIEAAWFSSSRYIFDAIMAIAPREPPGRMLWMMDADCVWVDPARALAARPTPPAIGCIQIPYPPDWRPTGQNRLSLGEIARRLGGGAGEPPPWVGGEVLAGTAADLRALTGVCEQLELEVERQGFALGTEEQLLTVAGALGRVSFADLSPLIRRVWTGPRHNAPPVADPASLAIWHLPSEKGLGFRRTARELLAGRGEELLSDLQDPSQAMRRFNVRGAGTARRLRDDLWLLGQRVLDVPLRRLEVWHDRLTRATGGG
jgi:hypothetical protein